MRPNQHAQYPPAGSAAGLSWSAGQRATVAGLCVVLALVAGVRLWQGGLVIDPLRPGDQSALLERLLDVNTASEAELASLPSVGPTRAAAIVDYRARWARSNPGVPAFASVDDLTNVEGIGPGVVKAIGGRVRFGPTMGP